MNNIKTQEYWEERHISDFWDWVNQSEYWKTKYFTRQVGSGLVRFISKQIPIHKNHLDYGSGNGDLLEILAANKNCQYFGLEYSHKSAKSVDSRLKEHTNWNGCSILNSFPSSYESSKFELITFIETIEHLKDEMLDKTLAELHRLLASGGYLIITCPFNETLSNNHVYCPFCKSEFHRMQHMRSFDKNSLSSLLESYGFKTILCTNTNFGRYNNIRSSILFRIQSTIQLLGLKKYQNDNKPHLVGIFTK